MSILENRLAAIEARIQKVGTEFRTELQRLRDQLAGDVLTPEVEATLDRLDATLEDLDSDIEDAPPPPPVDEQPADEPPADEPPVA